MLKTLSPFTKVDVDNGVIIGRGKEGNSFGKVVLSIYKINTAFLFAIGDSNAQEDRVSLAVRSIADYLKDNGYGNQARPANSRTAIVTAALKLICVGYMLTKFVYDAIME